MQFNFQHSAIPRWKLAAAITVLSLILLFTQLSSPKTSHKTLGSKMSVTHIVLFKFKPSTSRETIDDISQRMLALKDNCIDPSSGQPYIKSASGGTDNSPEGIQNGITHAFIVEFSSAKDRDYYVHNDPAHQEFKELAGKVLEKAQVVDFTDRVFEFVNVAR